MIRPSNCARIKKDSSPIISVRKGSSGFVAAFANIEAIFIGIYLGGIAALCNAMLYLHEAPPSGASSYDVVFVDQAEDAGESKFPSETFFVRGVVARFRSVPAFNFSTPGPSSRWKIPIH
jgi:hypothetical protein